MEAGAHLPTLLHNAGYQIAHANEPAQCWQQLYQSGGENLSATPACKGRIIFSVNHAHPDDALSALQAAVVALAQESRRGWRLNLRQRSLQAPNGRQIGLTSLEFIFIKIFSLTEIGQAVSRRQIVHEFGEDYLNYEQNRLDTMVRRLRQKIHTQTGMKLPLSTVRVRGYAFDDVLTLDIL